ncbi:MAG: hypothetical protein A2046_04825 [Bacteroidetes bacterium GWA2_30_7]|nr:MAG: hypothetical protein A2046_04825 [Bacteroidetes bacterium GWA2_30_7]
MRKLILLDVICLLYCLGFSQNNQQVDSLILIASSQKSDTNKILVLNKLSMYYEYSDTSKAWKYNRQAISENQTLQWFSGLAKSYMITGWLYQDISKYEIALDYMNKSLSLYQTLSKKNPKDLSNISNISGCYNNLGNIYTNKGNYPNALQNYILGLKKVENLLQNNIDNEEYLRKVTACYINLGSVYAYMNDNRNALSYFIKAKDMAVTLIDSNMVARCFINMGIIYKRDSLYDKAIESYQLAKKIFENQKDIEGIGLCMQNIGIAMLLNKTYDKAFEMEKQALEIVKALGNKQSECQILGTIGEILEKQNKMNEAEKYLKNAYIISEEINSLNDIKTHSNLLSDYYAKVKQFDFAYKYQRIYSDIKDSIYNIESSKQFTEMKEKYESDKKQMEIEKLGKQKELDMQTIIAQTAENKKQRILISSFVLGFILVLIFSVLLYRLFLQKKKANMLLAQQNAEIFQKNEEITAQRDEIETQRNLVTQQKESIEEIHKSVTDSINYAKRIQEAVLPISIKARAVLCQHFILFKPKDIVSGDFYFTTKVNNWTLVAVADCTGHGVPGAFMSMLGISFLNEIVRKKEITKASSVLNELRNEIVYALQQKGEYGEQKDGMDIAFVAINFETLELQFAGANNPLWIVRSKSDLTTFEKLSNLEEIKPDKMPIGIHGIMNDFTNHEIQLQKGDCIYMMSDGFQDQFGGLKRKKFLSKNLKQLLLVNSQLSMEEQKEIIEKEFENWINCDGKCFEQIDDITVVGLKI